MPKTNSKKVLTVGERLRGKRVRLGLSQGQAAELVGCSQPTWSQYENGQHVPRDERKAEIAYHFGIAAKAWEA